MSILTKVFVVLVTFLSVAVMALVVAFSANVENYKEKYKAENVLRKTAEAKAEDRQGEISRLIDHQGRTKDTHAATVSSLQSQVTKLDNELATAKIENQTLEAEKTTLLSTSTRLSALNTQLTSMKDAADTELANLRTRTTDQARQLVELADANAELVAARDAQTGIARRGAERITVLEQELLDLTAFIDKIPESVRTQASTRAKPGEVVPIWLDNVGGKVVHVTEKGGEIWVELNVGSNDTVVEGTWFIISRGETYLGDLIVDSVDVDAAAGRVRNPALGAGIKVGDDAISSPGT